MQALNLKNLAVRVGKKEVIKNLSLQIKPKELHVLMGPNGSGKSTLASALAGHPDYTIDVGSVTVDGQSILDKSPDERARLGLFLAFQYPVEIAGLSVQNFLRYAHQARFAAQPERQFSQVLAFRKHIQQLARSLRVDPALLERGLNEGFSGGEKKRLEILQMAVLEPNYAILDETDSGLDIDAVKKVAAGIEYVRAHNLTGMLVITHYQRILRYLKVDRVHVMVAGEIVAEGSRELVEKLEQSGYQEWSKEGVLV